MDQDDTWHVGFAVFGSHSRTEGKSRVRTSGTHPLQIATIPVGERGGRIGVTFCPGKKDPESASGAWDRDLSADISVIRAWGTSAVLTLLEPHEFALLGVTGLPQAVREAGMAFHHAPIPDVSVPGPAFEAAWPMIELQILNDLREGRSIVVHCRGGLGRAGMIAAKLLVLMGEDAERAIEWVRAVRPGAIETLDQEIYVFSNYPDRNCNSSAIPRS